MKFIHLSDTHLLGAPSDKLYGLKPAKRFKKALRSIQKHHSDAAFVVITGDITNGADPDAYKWLRKNVDAFFIPLFPLMGNHDDRSAFWRHFPEWKSGDFVQYVQEFDGCAFIFLDTLVEGKEYGMLCTQRLGWLKKQLDRYHDRPVYLFMHHHPVPSGLYRMDTVANFRASEAFWALIETHPSVRHIFFGHLHRPMHAIHRRIAVSATRSTTFQVAYRPDDETEYLTTTVQPAYSIVTLDGDDTVIHLCEYLGEYDLSRIGKGVIKSS